MLDVGSAATGDPSTLNFEGGSHTTVLRLVSGYHCNAQFVVPQAPVGCLMQPYAWFMLVANYRRFCNRLQQKVFSTVGRGWRHIKAVTVAHSG